MSRAVIFDLDGTLLDTLEDLGECTNAVLRWLGQPEHPREAYRWLVGEGMEQLVRGALPEGHRDQATVTRGLERLKREYATGWQRHTRPYPGIVAALRELAAARVPAAVLSNKADEFTQEMVTHFFGASAFTRVLGSRPGVPRKPDPAAALDLAAALAVPPADIAFVGDTRVDMQTAVQAGMRPLGVTWGFRPESELREHGARAIVHAPAELLAAITAL
jgi:phosphoglycolate phosphatase